MVGVVSLFRHIAVKSFLVIFRLFIGRNSCRCFCVELVKLLHVHRNSVDIFHILVLHEYWFLTESRILLKSVLGGVRYGALSISSNEQT